MECNRNISLLDKYITQKMIMLRKQKNIFVGKLADILKIDNSFIYKVESYHNKYNLYHLFLINLEVNQNTDISYFFPEEKSYKKVNGFQNYSNFLEFLNEIKENILSKKIWGGLYATKFIIFRRIKK